MFSARNLSGFLPVRFAVSGFAINPCRDGGIHVLWGARIRLWANIRMPSSKRILSRAIFEVMEARQLLASISGTVFYDDDLDGAIETGEGGLAGWTVYADTNNNGTFDGENTTYASAGSPLAIPDNTTVNSPITIAGNGGVANSVRVKINIAHTWLEDLDIFLVAPDGTRVTLTADQGGDGDNFTNTVFDDTAGRPIPRSSAGAPFTGSFRPTTPLSVLAGQPIDGTWTLEITDDSTFDPGTLLSWSLNFKSGEPSIDTNTSGEFTLVEVPVGTYSVHLMPQQGWQQAAASASVVIDDIDTFRSGVDFGVRQPPGSLNGIVYADYNLSGNRDADEPGLSDRTVYIDLDNDSELDSNEPSTVTNASGAYSFTGLRPGKRYVRTVLPHKWFQTAPAAPGMMGLSSAAPSSAAASSDKAYLQGQMIVSVNSRARLDHALSKLSNRSLSRTVSMQRASTLGKTRGDTILFINVNKGSDAGKIAKLFSSLAGVNWAQPNYLYAPPKNAREYDPDDTSYLAQWHHVMMQNNLAWNLSEGAGIKIGVADDGIQLDHPDLVDNLYVNTNEIAGNGIDDDANGYIDDVSGWDFTNSTTPGTGDNNANPDIPGHTHGTNVAGIIGARTNNGLGVSGTAGRATIVPLRFFGTGQWTSTVIWNTYKYAADHGVKILNTSYNIDSFANDNLFTQAQDYLYDHGVLHFNSAGNSSQLNPARQKWGQLLLVSSTTASDTKAVTSNYGSGMDLSAPGAGIYTTATNGAYALVSGTSMATPNAAAVAALIWSAHPTWTRDQVAAQLLGMADNIDGVNPAFAGLLGTGRVNSYRALTQTLGAPKLRGVIGLPSEGGNFVSSPSQFRVQFLNILDAATANNAGNWKLVGAGIDDLFDTADDVQIPISVTPDNPTYRIGTNEFVFNVNALLTAGLYRFSASNLADPFGTPLDGNGDGTGGDAFVRHFTISGVTVAADTTLLPAEEKQDVNFGMRETIAPRVVSSLFGFEIGLKLEYVFSEDMAAITKPSIQIVNTTTSQTLSESDYEVSFDPATLTATITLNSTIASGNYVATLLSNQTSDRFNNKLDGDADNLAGGDYSFSFSFVQGDVTRDGVVNFDDLLVLAQNYGGTGKTFSQGNVTFDAAGNVDFDDLLLLAQHYNAGTSGSLVAPSSTKSRAKSRAASAVL